MSHLSVKSNSRETVPRKGFLQLFEGAELALALGISWEQARHFQQCRVPSGEAFPAREGMGGGGAAALRKPQLSTGAPLLLDQRLLHCLSLTVQVGSREAGSKNREIRCAPPWVGLPQAHLQLGHGILLFGASMSLSCWSHGQLCA